MAQPSNPDGFTGPSDENFEYAWLATSSKRDYSAEATRVESVEEWLDGDPNYPEME